MKLTMALKRRTTNFTSGQTMTEYVLIVSAIAIAVIGAYNAFGGTLTAMVEAITSAL
jgi:Flp pilus assembly pilin Flp